MTSTDKEIEKQAWIALSNEVGYEGAGVIMVNDKQEIFFLVSGDKDGSDQVEIGGGKVEISDNGNSKATALRELKEETGIVLTEDDLVTKLSTTGGTTGMPSIQYVTRPVNGDEICPVLEKRFYGTVWSKVMFSETNGWTIQGGTPIRKFNRFFFEQNKDALKDYFF